MSSVTFDGRQLQSLSTAFRRVAPETYKAEQRVVRTALLGILSDAAAHAPGNRIPRSGKVLMRGLSGRVRFGGNAAPDAAPIENNGKGFVRHPLFGNRSYWYENPQPAYLHPAFDRGAPLAYEAAATAAATALTIVLGDS